jgi:PAS domain S-box-containing protein
MKKLGFDARIAICIAGFILAILLVAADEILDIPYHLFNAPPTPINWTEIGIESIFILTVGSLTISILWRVNLKRERVEGALKESERRLSNILSSMVDLVFVLDKDSRFTSFYVPSNELYVPPEEFVGKKYSDVMPPHVNKLMAEALDKNKKGEVAEFEYCLEIGGQTQWYYAKVSPMLVVGKFAGCVAVARNTTERKQAQEKILHLYGTLLTIRKVNQLIVEVDNESELLVRACDTLVDGRNYKMAWVGFASDGSYDVLPVAQAGFEEGYLSSIKITWDDSEYGRGPTGVAMRTRRPSVMRDIVNDKRYLPWHEEALKRGYTSSAALPLMVEDKVIGALNVYSGNPNVFDDAEISMLVELAGDISLGIERIRQRTELRQSEERYLTTLNSMLEGCQIIDFDWRYTYLNDAAARHGHHAKEELLGHTMMEIYPGIEDTEMFVNLRNCMEKRIPHRMENIFIYPDGSQGWFELSIEPVRQGIFVLSLDITERKRAEERIINLNSVLKALRSVNQLIVHEKDREHLIQKSCDLMVETRGFLCAWILLFDEKRKYISAAVAGGKEMQAFSQQLDQGSYPPCIDPIVAHKDIFAVCDDIVENGVGCLPKDYYGGGKGLISRLEYEGKVYGIVSVYVPSDYAFDPEQQSLFKELAGDIAFDLSSIEKEEQRKQAEKTLIQSEERFKAIFDTATDGILLANLETKYFFDGNKAICRMLGYTQEEISNIGIMDIHPQEELPRVIEVFEAQAKGTIALSLDIPMKRKDGSVFYADVNSASVTFAGKTYLMGMFRDATERRKAEEEMDRLAKFPSEDPNPVLRVAKDGTILYANKVSSPLLDVWKCGVGQHLPKYMYKYVLDILDAKTSKNTEVNCDDRIFFLTFAPVMDAGYVNIYAYDITEHRQAEESLRLTEQNFRNSMDYSPLGIRIVTVEGELLYANQAILNIYGYSSVEELKATITKERYTPESYAEHQKRKGKRKLNEPVPSNYEISIVRKNGEARHLILSRKAVLWDGEVQFQTVYQDITERKQAEEALRESEGRYRTLFESAAEGILVADIEAKKFKYANPAFCTMLGYSQEELTKMSVSDIHPKTSLEHVLADFADQARGEKILSPALRCLKKDGTIIYADIKAAKTIIDGRECNVGFFTDITERRQVEEEIRQAAEEWRTTFNSITDLISIHDKDFKLVRVNKAFADTLKMKPEELIGKTCYQVIHGTTEPVSSCPHMKTLKTKKPAMGELFESHLGIHLEVATSPIFNDKGEVVASVHVARDITERKKMEEHLILTDRLASIGQLASGIAHELNNPLTGVIGFSELLLERDLPDDIKEDLEIVNREAKRTANVVKGLLTFARKQGTEKELVDISSIIRGVLQLRSYEQRVSNIEVKNLFASDLPKVMGSGAQLQQVFLNIIVNAEQAMLEAHGRGRLTITTERVGDIVRASITDDGPGISPENMKRIFTPFFTTKEVGKGTGLGLSICHGIVTEHDGKIYAESERGKGATFIVELPISQY